MSRLDKALRHRHACSHCGVPINLPSLETCLYSLHTLMWCGTPRYYLPKPTGQLQASLPCSSAARASGCGRSHQWPLQGTPPYCWGVQRERCAHLMSCRCGACLSLPCIGPASQSSTTQHSLDELASRGASRRHAPHADCSLSGRHNLITRGWLRHYEPEPAQPHLV